MGFLQRQQKSQTSISLFQCLGEKLKDKLCWGEMVQSDRAAQTREYRTSVPGNQLYPWKAQLDLKNKNHRTEWFVLKGTFKIIYFPCYPLDQAAQGPVQLGLQHFQGWGIHKVWAKVFSKRVEKCWDRRPQRLWNLCLTKFSQDLEKPDPSTKLALF